MSFRGTVGRVALVFGGNAGAMFLGLVGNAWAMQVLGPEGYGPVAVALVVLYIVWQFTGKGLDQAAIRLAAVTRHRRGPAEIFEAVYALKLVGNGALLLIGVVLAGPLTRLLVGPEASVVPMYLAFVGAAAASLWGFHSSALQAESRFGHYTPVQVANNALKLIALALIIVSGALTATTFMAAATVGFLGAGLLGGVLAPAYARRPRWIADSIPVIIRYSRWLLISSVLFLLYSRLDLLMLSRMTDAETVGLYAAAALIAQMADLLAASILTVFLPRFVPYTEKAPLREQVRASLRCSLLLVIPLIPCYLLISPAMHMLFGSEYAGAVLFLKIMYFGVLFTMVTHPLHILFYALGRPQILTALDVFMLIFNAVGHFYAISHYGAPGAAVVALLSRVVAGLLLSVGVFAELGTGKAAGGE